VSFSILSEGTSQVRPLSLLYFFVPCKKRSGLSPPFPCHRFFRRIGLDRSQIPDSPAPQNRHIDNPLCSISRRSASVPTTRASGLNKRRFIEQTVYRLEILGRLPPLRAAILPRMTSHLSASHSVANAPPWHWRLRPTAFSCGPRMTGDLLNCSKTSWPNARYELNSASLPALEKYLSERSAERASGSVVVTTSASGPPWQVPWVAR
jgi:hypothetical protein